MKWKMRFIRHRFACNPAQLPPITHNGRPLKTSRRAKQHCPNGYNWGYIGLGPKALAHTILCHVAGARTANRLYLAFEREVIAALPRSGWRLTDGDVRSWLARYTRAQREARASRQEIARPSANSGARQA